jgi:hypothetical protein
MAWMVVVAVDEATGEDERKCGDADDQAEESFHGAPFNAADVPAGSCALSARSHDVAEPNGSLGTDALRL